ncbi:chemokine vCXCL2 [Cercopithecine betaherpesvirus 5]|uniref:Chemokine vCXCL2 n=1 Tax=Simian cytomegalovirus (strain Colburn) TaxID=50292 RepID=G8XTI5_SCMVC|nr:chemokine vCXCL2 [Cercopithecine betaherpesvirus 5]AEV80477.1 chemokine vCXCL2 [Cercopithecine betaherpesvirus 5]
MQYPGCSHVYLTGAILVMFLSWLYANNVTDVQLCKCLNATLLAEIPTESLYLKPFAPSENCSRQEVIAVLQNQSEVCLNASVQAVRYFFNRLFYRLIRKDNGLFDVLDTKLHMPAWNITRRFYRGYLKKTADKLNRHIIAPNPRTIL